ncbi:Alpha/Beta hydrolase protein [Pterulicium gracile]|uniref:Alpha/Beta hydrolase protein n=1 Tax=Pterulicium gracile TaxID=1884261 RepID=A0A5C3QP85_9AGAR|nr:Alpha/Beta hydrolase protein [Pterula gracilis]
MTDDVKAPPSLLADAAVPAVDETSPRTYSLLRRMRYVSTTFGSLYLVAVLLLTIPFIQTHTLYLNALRFPWFAKFDQPAFYGLAPGKTLNLQLNTSDHETLGAWFVFSDHWYRSQPFPPPATPSLESVQTAVQNRPTILFFHGNAATRAFHVRVAHYQAYSARLNVNVLAIDYRGYADSTGRPSEDGLALDARAAWDWLLSHGTKAEDILIVGHSLGTAVSARLAGDLSAEGSRYRGVVMMSPFSSIESVLNTYSILGLFPVMRPLTVIPRAPGLVAKALIHKFDTLDAFHRVTGPTLIAHSVNDMDIPDSHSDVLFDSIIEPHLAEIKRPSIRGNEWKDSDWEEFKNARAIRKDQRAALVQTLDIRNFGILENASLPDRKVSLLKALKGGHDRLGIQEGVQDVMRIMFDL